MSNLQFFWGIVCSKLKFEPIYPALSIIVYFCIYNSSISMLKMKYLAFFIAVMLLTFTDAEAQVRKRTTTKSSQKAKEKKESVSLLTKLNPEIKLGNVGFFNGLFISSKLNAGIKLHNRFSLGAGTKLFFNQYSQPGTDPSIFDFGGLVYGRAKITNSVYFQAEYAFMKYGKDPDNYYIRGITESQTLNYPLLGIGYFTGVGNWRFGMELLYITNNLARDYQNSIVEYWFGGSYNF